MHQVLIRVQPDGTATVKAEGFTGPSCTLVTEPFIKALGQVVSDTPTAEMFQTAEQTQEVKQ